MFHVEEDPCGAIDALRLERFDEEVSLLSDLVNGTFQWSVGDEVSACILLASAELLPVFHVFVGIASGLFVPGLFLGGCGVLTVLVGGASTYVGFLECLLFGFRVLLLIDCFQRELPFLIICGLLDLFAKFADFLFGGVVLVRSKFSIIPVLFIFGVFELLEFFEDLPFVVLHLLLGFVWEVDYQGRYISSI